MCLAATPVLRSGSLAAPAVAVVFGVLFADGDFLVIDPLARRGAPAAVVTGGAVRVPAPGAVVQVCVVASNEPIGAVERVPDPSSGLRAGREKRHEEQQNGRDELGRCLHVESRTVG